MTENNRLSALANQLMELYTEADAILKSDDSDETKIEKLMGHPVVFKNRRNHNISLDDPAREAIDTIRLLAPQCGITDPVVTKSDVIRFALRYVAEALQDMDNPTDDNES